MLGWLLVIQIVVALLGRSIGPLAPLIQEDLSLTKAQVGLLPAALFFGQTLVSIPAGLITDLLGSRRLLLGLCLWLGGCFALLSLAPAFLSVLILITLGGLGYGTMHPASGRAIQYLFSVEQRGTAMGIKGMGITIGSATAALVLLPSALAIEGSSGWRVVLVATAGLLMMIGVLSVAVYRNPRENAQTTSTSKIQRVQTTLARLPSLFRNKLLWLISLAAAGLSGAQMALNTYLVFFGVEVLGFTLSTAALLFVISEIGGSVGRLGWGYLSDRIFGGKRIVVFEIVAILVIACGLFMAYISHALDTTGLRDAGGARPGTVFIALAIITIGIFGLTANGFNGVWMNTASESVPRQSSGVATGFSISIGSCGVFLVPPLFGLLVDTSGTYVWPWIFLGTLAMFALVMLRLATRLATDLQE